MTSFDDELAAMADRARQSAQAGQDERAAEEREEEAARTRAHALQGEIAKELARVAADDRLPIHVKKSPRNLADEIGWSVTWTDPQPERTLELWLDRKGGRVRSAWHQHPESRMRWH